MNLQEKQRLASFKNAKYLRKQDSRFSMFEDFDEDDLEDEDFPEIRIDHLVGRDFSTEDINHIDR